ncbi:MAG: DUF6175 family protein [Candidatus Cloacimonadota bacterium]|nr:DUF6175 family protein [Candidatus Cloacimonadota bacterium]
MKFLKLSTILLLFIPFSVFAQLPVSRQAHLVESVSSSEVLIEATGIYNSPFKGGAFKKSPKKDVDENGVRFATEDAKKAAVYFILFGGTDPLLNSDEAKTKFNEISSEFFKMSNISQYITYEDNQLLKRIKIDDGKGIKITKRFKINKGMIKKYLESKNIIKSRKDLSSTIGNPFIMVIPATTKSQNPIELLRDDKEVKQAAAVIESYLTARQYDVVVPEQQANLDELNKAQAMVGNRDEDYAYQLALSVGSDVYITFSGSLENAAYGTKKYTISIKAYETTTARLLGTETGYSESRSGEIMLSIEEAVNDAIDKVLARIHNYWENDLKDGVQYKIIVNLAPDFDEEELEEVQWAFMDAVDEVANKSKENVVTDQTIDYLVWCNPQKYDRSSQVYRFIQKAFRKQDVSASLKRISINRKMILLKIDSE